MTAGRKKAGDRKKAKPTWLINQESGSTVELTEDGKFRISVSRWGDSHTVTVRGRDGTVLFNETFE